MIHCMLTSQAVPPLAGKTILTTRSREQQPHLTALLTNLGAQVTALPLLEITAPSDWEPLDQTLKILNSFQWLLLTSTNGVDYFFNRLDHLGVDQEYLASLKIIVVGEKTRLALAQKGFTAHGIPERFDSEGILAVLAQEALQGARVLFPRVESGGREIITQTLGAWGAEVFEVPAYSSKAPSSSAEDFQNVLSTQTIDAVTFTSAKMVRHFAQLIQHIPDLDLTGIALVTIGPQTAQTCHELLGRMDAMADPYTLEGLAQALIDYFHPNSRADAGSG